MAGNYHATTILHELGHALGLNIGHDFGFWGTLPRAGDALEFTVMSYRTYVGAPLEQGYTAEQWGFPQSYMMYDIAALQHLYGADFETRAGDTLYSSGSGHRQDLGRRQGRHRAGGKPRLPDCVGRRRNRLLRPVRLHHRRPRRPGAGRAFGVRPGASPISAAGRTAAAPAAMSTRP